MKFAAIDIGSNAVRLLLKFVYETENGPVFIKDSLYRVPVRLGEQAFSDGKFTADKMQDLVTTMKAFSHLIDVHKVVGYKAVATSAMRDSSNGLELVEKVRRACGLEIDIISGSREASVILHSEFGMHQQDDNKHYLYIDVGGGSTELVYFFKGEIRAAKSFRIGTLRLLNDQVNEGKWAKMQEWLSEHRPPRRVVTGIGSGGNINKMIKLYGRAPQTFLTRETVLAANKHLTGLTFGERVKDLGLKPDRADVIVPASLIFRNVMTWTNVRQIIVPKFGLSDGIIRELYLQHVNEEL